MIAALALALQLAAAPSVLSVRSATGRAAVPLVPTPAGVTLSAERVAGVLPLTIRHLANDRWVMRVAGVELDLLAHDPYVRAGRSVLPLASAPVVEHDALLVPLQLFAELLPRLAPTRLRYDPAHRELTVLPIPASSDVHPAVAVAPARRRPLVARRATHARRRLVVVDAGHGGPDNGMSGPLGTHWKIYEKDITLAVAKKLATALGDRGVGVVMTRTTDTLIALSDRGRIANEHHGDVFVSIHVNAANPSWSHPAEARGFETYFLAEAKTEDAKRVEQMENESVRFETAAQASKDDALDFIIHDMAQNEHLRESSELADLIQARLGQVEPGPSRGVKQAGFRVLVTAYMPAVLVEIGFGTNADEARFLTSPSRQRSIANAIADATVEYLDRYQRRLAGGSSDEGGGGR